MYMYEISDWIGGFENSVQVLIFFAVIALILLLLYKGFKGGASKREFPAGLFGLAALGIFIGFIHNIISPYYLPDWMTAGRTEIWELDFSLASIAFLILGVGFLIWGLIGWSKKKESLARAFRRAFK